MENNQKRKVTVQFKDDQIYIRDEAKNQIRIKKKNKIEIEEKLKMKKIVLPSLT